ncbi:MAG: NAD(P)/FAD-dependent oxidoreductase [Prevotella sp.]|nr:NAD(P)/FAD-dependent oxidoreductase [Prevotella sp.]MDY6130888.1 NAD(P)/FAD-dependent oxidoreductase [Prevotella sp.]
MKRTENGMLSIAIIGGGAAGFFAAITAKEHNPDAEVTIFERSRKVLAKVEISGGGRCNLTNSFQGVSDMKQVYPRGDKLMKRLFKSFGHEDTCSWFESRGVTLVTQDDACVFPRSQSALSIVNCLVDHAKALGVKIRTGCKIVGIEPLDDGCLRLQLAGGASETFCRVAVATGGSPRMEGLQYLADMGHELVPPVPALFTFNLADPSFKALMGTVADPVTVSIPETKFRSSGALLVTHWGASGPAILKLSSLAARWVKAHDYRFAIAVNWVNETNQNKVGEMLASIIKNNAQKQLGTIHPFGLPGRLWLYLLEKLALPSDRKWGETGKKTVNKLVETLTNDIYQVAGKGSFRDEFVTCGGVALSNVNLNTLESKSCPHLFFAGEVLDIDAVTGGFNLQAAWTTGHTVGKNIALDDASQ